MKKRGSLYNVSPERRHVRRLQVLKVLEYPGLLMFGTSTVSGHYDKIDYTELNHVHPDSDSPT